MTEVEKSSRSVMEQTFYTKLGPTPDLPSRVAEDMDVICPALAISLLIVVTRQHDTTGSTSS
jgi:hypothetical protein